MAALLKTLVSLSAISKEAEPSGDPLLFRLADLPPYGAIEALVKDIAAPDAAAIEAAAARFRRPEAPAEACGRLLFLEGSLLEKAGRRLEAAEKFRAAFSSGAGSTAPLLALARC